MLQKLFINLKTRLAKLLELYPRVWIPTIGEVDSFRIIKKHGMTPGSFGCVLLSLFKRTIGVPWITFAYQVSHSATGATEEKICPAWRIS